MSNYQLNVEGRLNDKKIKEQLKELSRSQKFDVKIEGGKAVKKLTKDISVYEDSMGNIVKATSTLNKKTEEWSHTITATAKEAKETAKQTQAMSSQIKTATKKSKNFASSFITITKKVAAFGLATNFIGLFTSAITEAKDAVFEFDKALTEMKKVSSLSNDELATYTEQLGKMGEEVARTRSEMTEASTEFIKSGYSEEDSAILARVATLYQNIADSEMTAGDSASFVISQMKAFGIEAENAESIIDKVNEVSNNFAVSSTDISLALTKTSSAMAVLGNDINETIGLVTAG